MLDYDLEGQCSPGSTLAVHVPWQPMQPSVILSDMEHLDSLGMDIGDTEIGMHVRFVQRPVLSVTIGRPG